MVVGCSGAGKSTLAAAVAERAQLPFVPTDPFYWQKGWQPAPQEAVLERLHAVLSQPVWVMDGNFEDQREIVWAEADALVWLDYSLPVILRRGLKRNIRLYLSGEPTWSGNRMTLPQVFSGVRHALRSFPNKRKAYPSYLHEFPQLKVLHFRQPAEAERWLAAL